jgi:hypothetical protein
MAEEKTEMTETPDSGTETTKTSHTEIVGDAAEANVIVEKKTATTEANEI